MRPIGARVKAAAVALAAATAVSAIGPSSEAGTTKTWHIMPASVVENARLTEDVIKNIDPAITTVEYRQGGLGNIEVCGFDLTEQISVSRQARWKTSAASLREGSTVILQLRNVVDGGTAFSRMRSTYAACTPQNGGFTKPNRTTVKYAFLTKKKQIRLVWELYTTDTKTTLQRAEALSIKRAGGALIITRSIVTNATSPTELRTDINSTLTARQFGKYKAAAYF